MNLFSWEDFDYSSNSLSWKIKDNFLKLNQFALLAVFP